jgi:hypothetical protein
LILLRFYYAETMGWGKLRLRDALLI